jgi:hypothetical protein
LPMKRALRENQRATVHEARENIPAHEGIIGEAQSFFITSEDHVAAAGQMHRDAGLNSVHTLEQNASWRVTQGKVLSY